MYVSWPVKCECVHYELKYKYRYVYNHIPTHHVLKCILATSVIHSRLARLALMNKFFFSFSHYMTYSKNAKQQLSWFLYSKISYKQALHSVNVISF